MSNEITGRHVEERLLDYAYDELDGGARGEVEAHLAVCSQCRASLAGISSTRNLMRTLPSEAPPSAGMESLLAYAAQAAARKPREPFYRKTWFHSLALSGVTLGMFLLVVLTVHEAQRQANAPAAVLAQADAPRDSSTEGAARRPPLETDPARAAGIAEELARGKKRAFEAPAKAKGVRPPMPAKEVVSRGLLALSDRSPSPPAGAPAPAPRPQAGLLARSAPAAEDKSEQAPIAMAAPAPSPVAAEAAPQPERLAFNMDVGASKAAGSLGEQRGGGGSAELGLRQKRAIAAPKAASRPAAPAAPLAGPASRSSSEASDIDFADELNRAQALEAAGSFPQALAAYSRALAVDPSHSKAPEALFARARLLERLGRHAEALQDLNGFLSKFPSHPLAAQATLLRAEAQRAQDTGQQK